MMDLHSEITLDELEAEVDERFDFLKDLTEYVARIDEVHESEDADDEYFYLAWLKEGADVGIFSVAVLENFRKECGNFTCTCHGGWKMEVTVFGGRFLVVRTWL